MDQRRSVYIFCVSSLISSSVCSCFYNVLTCLALAEFLGNHANASVDIVAEGPQAAFRVIIASSAPVGRNLICRCDVQRRAQHRQSYERIEQSTARENALHFVDWENGHSKSKLLD